jgi:hypothetical protein
MGFDYSTVIVAALGVGIVLVAGGVLLPVFWLRQRRRNRARPARPAAQTAPDALVGLPAAADAPTPPPGPRVVGRLALVDEAARAYEIASLPAVVGRAAACAVRIDHPSVSAEHARVYHHPELGVVIEDLQSLNGLHVDGQPTARNSLRDGARVTLGTVTLTVKLAAAPAA